MIRWRNCGVKWKEKLWQNKWQLLVLLLVLLVQCFYISRKQGYHMDELLTFELGNAEYNPWIVPTQPVGRLAKFMQQEIYADSLAETFGNLTDTVKDVLQNRGSSKLLSYQADVYEEPVWITREQFHEYITVGERDGFNYLSVYFNVKDDNHPPLYFMLVHTLSSVFPHRISPWMGCFFNLAAVLGCCILMFAMGRLLAAHDLVEKKTGELWGLCSGLLYGCSSGAIAATVFIRMYEVLTFFCVLSLYLHLRKWLGGRAQNGMDFTGKNKLLILVTALGFWTQYFFLFYCLLLAFVTVIVLLREGRKREGFCYIRSMVLAGIIGVGIYPFSVKHILTSGRGVEAIGNLLSGLAGYGGRLAEFGKILLLRTFGQQGWGLAVLAVLALTAVGMAIRRRRRGDRSAGVCFENGGAAVRAAGENSAAGGVTTAAGTAAAAADAARVRRELAALLILPPSGYFLLAAKMSPYMVDRYIMPVFPFAAMGAAALLCYALSGRRAAAAVLTLLLAAVNIGTYDGEYLYQGYSTQLAMAEVYRELPCICIYEGYGFYDNLLEFETYERTLLLKPSELEDRQEQDLESLEEAVVLIKQNADADRALALLADYGLEPDQILVRGSVYGDLVVHCVREP